MELSGRGVEWEEEGSGNGCKTLLLGGAPLDDEASEGLLSCNARASRFCRSVEGTRDRELGLRSRSGAGKEFLLRCAGFGGVAGVLGARRVEKVWSNHDSWAKLTSGSLKASSGSPHPIKASEEGFEAKEWPSWVLNLFRRGLLCEDKEGERETGW